MNKNSADERSVPLPRKLESDEFLENLNYRYKYCPESALSDQNAEHDKIRFKDLYGMELKSTRTQTGIVFELVSKSAELAIEQRKS